MEKHRYTAQQLLPLSQQSVVSQLTSYPALSPVSGYLLAITAHISQVNQPLQKYVHQCQAGKPSIPLQTIDRSIIFSGYGELIERSIDR